MESEESWERAEAERVLEAIYDHGFCVGPCCNERRAFIESALQKAKAEGIKEGARLDPDVKSVLCYEAGLEEGRAEERKWCAEIAETEEEPKDLPPEMLEMFLVSPEHSMRGAVIATKKNIKKRILAGGEHGKG